MVAWPRSGLMRTSDDGDRAVGERRVVQLAAQEHLGQHVADFFADAQLALSGLALLGHDNTPCGTGKDAAKPARRLREGGDDAEGRRTALSRRPYYASVRATSAIS